MSEVAVDTIAVERLDGGIARIVLCRPEVKNALRLHEMLQVGELFSSLAAEARCIVVTGRGDSFCAGRDLSEARDDDDTLSMLDGTIHPAIAAVAACPVPTIAQVRGPALGFGFGLAMACDLTLVSDDARLGSPFRNIGCVPDCGAHWQLAKRVGRHVALELIYTGRLVGGREAARIGLVNRSVAGMTLERDTLELAREIAAGPPLAFAASKRILGQADSLERCLELEAVAQADALATDDGREGIRAFQQKRRPKFIGS